MIFFSQQRKQYTRHFPEVSKQFTTWFKNYWYFVTGVALYSDTVRYVLGWLAGWLAALALCLLYIHIANADDRIIISKFIVAGLSMKRNLAQI